MKRPSRVLMTADAVGGVWSYAIDLARGLTGKGIEVDLALLGPAPDAKQIRAARAIEGLQLIVTDAELDWLSDGPADVARSAASIRDLLDRRGADILHLNSPALAAEVGFDLPVLAGAHSCLGSWWDAVRGDALPADFAWRDRQHGQGLRRADLVAAPSRAFAEVTRERHHLREMPEVIHNGRKALASNPSVMHDFAFTAGRLWDEGKNLLTLDRAAARLAVPLKAAGACQAPHGGQARFEHLCCLGQIGEAELGSILAARPVFASAAIYEPFGLAVLEAAAAGCPLVLSDIPTFRELWDGAATFVAADDDRGFAGAIDRLISDSALRLACGHDARRRARRFSLENMTEQVVAAYGALLSRTLPAAGKAAA